MKSENLIPKRVMCQHSDFLMPDCILAVFTTYLTVDGCCGIIY
jgi:hypothetical protein